VNNYGYQTKRIEKIDFRSIEVYHSLPALWNVKSKDYSNRIKKLQYEHLLRKYRDIFLDADQNQSIKNLIICVLPSEKN
jgi:hypothetical protein